MHTARMARVTSNLGAFEKIASKYGFLRPGDTTEMTSALERVSRSRHGQTLKPRPRPRSLVTLLNAAGLDRVDK